MFINAQYNCFHRHSDIKYVMPDEKHAGLDIAILANRRRLYKQGTRTQRDGSVELPETGIQSQRQK